MRSFLVLGPLLLANPALPHRPARRAVDGDPTVAKLAEAASLASGRAEGLGHAWQLRTGDGPRPCW